VHGMIVDVSSGLFGIINIASGHFVNKTEEARTPQQRHHSPFSAMKLIQLAFLAGSSYGYPAPGKVIVLGEHAVVHSGESVFLLM
jgi:hypothetical protein